LAPGGKERAQTGWIPAETCGEFVVEEEEVVVVEASPVGFVRVASWGNSGRRKALGGRSGARMGEKIIKEKRKIIGPNPRWVASVGGW
jgi:hypothetical protein